MRVALVLLFWCLMAATCLGEEGLSPEHEGLLETFGTIFQSGVTGNTETQVWLHLREKFVWDINQTLQLEGAYEVLPAVSTEDISATGIQQGKDFRYVDLEEELWSPSAKVVVYQNLDRLSLSIYTERGAFVLGRQGLSPGVARGISPLDLFQRLPLATPFFTEIRGVDAFLARFPLKETAEISGAVVLGEKGAWEESATFVSGRLTLGTTDARGLVGIVREYLVLGGATEMPVKDAGVWLEALEIVPQKDGDSFFRLTCGVEYFFSSGLYVFGEYHYNGPGSQSPQDYQARAESPLYEDLNLYFLGRHYLTGGLQYRPNPVLLLSANLWANVAPLSNLLQVEAGVSPKEDFDLTLGGVLNIGDEEGEFHDFPRSAYLRLRYYF